MQSFVEVANCMGDLNARPDLFAVVPSGDETPQDVIESIKAPHADPSKWRARSSTKTQLLPPPALPVCV